MSIPGAHPKQREACETFKAQFHWQLSVFVVTRKQGRIPLGASVRPRRVLVYGPLSEGGVYGAGVGKDETFRQVGPALWESFGASSKVTREETADFFETIGSAFSSGQSVISALGMAARTVRTPKMRGVIGAITFMITRGIDLHNAMRLFPDVFTQMQVSLAEAADKTGLEKAGQVFIRLAGRMQRQERLWRKFFAAIAYPLTMLLFSLSVALVLEMVALPPMMELFRTMGARLPAISQWFYDGALYLKRFAWIIFPTLIFAVVLIAGSLPLLVQKRWVQRLSVRAPFVGVVLRQMALARAIWTYILLKQSGASVSDTFLLAGASSGNAVVADFFAATLRRVQLGDSIEDAFIAERHQLGGDGDRIAGKMEAGMTGGDLVSLLGGVADDLVDKAESRIAVLPRMLEWPLLIVVGFILSMIILAIFLPYPSLLTEMMSKIAHG